MLAVVATRLLGGLLFEVDALDPLTLVSVPLVLRAAALVAAYLPTRRASGVHPATVLRTDSRLATRHRQRTVLEAMVLRRPGPPGAQVSQVWRMSGAPDRSSLASHA